MQAHKPRAGVTAYSTELHLDVRASYIAWVIFRATTKDSGPLRRQAAITRPWQERSRYVSSSSSPSYQLDNFLLH